MLTTASEIANYWAWHLERAKLIGLALQVGGLFFFLALWWNQERGWRASRWPLVIYLGLLGIIRYATWMIYGIASPSPTPIMKAFMIRSGIVGLFICFVMIVFLIMDRGRNWVRLLHFGPEAWNARMPNALQWTGLLVAFICLWYPLVPHPQSPGATLVTNGFPTSFGVTLTPTLLFLGGLVVAGNRTPPMVPAVCLGAGATISSIAADPLTVHGAIAGVVGILIALAGVILGRSQRDNLHQAGKSGTM